MRKVAIVLLILLLMSSVTAVVGNEEDSENGDSGDIVLIPESPTAGKNLIFYLPSINVSANGYVICENNNVYLLEIYNGLGQITLDKNDYGEATVKLFASNETYMKTFEVKPFLAGTLVIEAASSVLINTETTIKVAVGATPTEGAVVTFKSLSGRSFNRIVDGNGNILLSFDEDGPWEIQTEFYGVTASATIKVMLPPIEIVFPENIEVNDEMLISIGSYADITITKDEITWVYWTDANGDLYFTPPWPGKYSIYAKTDKQEGIRTFITISETRIDVYDYEKSVPISKIKKGQLVKIVLVDSSGIPISEIDEVLVYCDNVLWDSLPLSAGSVIWKVNKEATVYRFEFEAVEGYKSSETMVYRLTEAGAFPFLDIIFYVVLVIIILVVAVVFIRHQRSGKLTGKLRLPKLFGKKLTDITHRGKRLE